MGPCIARGADGALYGLVEVLQEKKPSSKLDIVKRDRWKISTCVNFVYFICIWELRLLN